MKKLALNKETVRQLDDGVLRQVQAGGPTERGNCQITFSCLTVQGCRTELIC